PGPRHAGPARHVGRGHDRHRQHRRRGADRKLDPEDQRAEADAGPGPMTLHLAPVTAAGRALHPFADTHPRLTADTLRPYAGILGAACPPSGADARSEEHTSEL